MTDLYDLSNKLPISSLSLFASIKDEYEAAFADSGMPFLYLFCRWKRENWVDASLPGVSSGGCRWLPLRFTGNWV